MELKDKIKLYRKENGLTQQMLASKIGVSRSNIAELERGTYKGTVKFITKMSQISGKSITYWSDSSIEDSYQIYQALDILIDAMIENGNIKENTKIDKNSQELIMRVLEKEIKYKLKKKKEEQGE